MCPPPPNLPKAGEKMEKFTSLFCSTEIEKAPSAGLFDGQTDEADMGLKYADLDEYILTGHTNEKAAATIERLHRNSRHKRDGIARFSR